MPSHIEVRQVPYSQAQMFALVADIKSYPDFLPWCQRAVITQTTETGVVADLYVGAKGFREKFTSIVTMAPNEQIKVAYGGGPLKSLANEWRFHALPNGGCEIRFFVDFSMKSTLMAVLMEAFFEYAFKKMVHSFETRARELYS